MKERVILTWLCIIILAVLCLVDVITGKWLNLASNAIWLAMAFVMLSWTGKYKEMMREKRELEILNKKFGMIIGNFASDCGKINEAFVQTNKARKEAKEESLLSEEK